MSLSSLGWDAFFAGPFHPYAADGLVAARVALEHKNAYVLLDGSGELHAVCTGQLLHRSSCRADLPAVGDWVAIRLRPADSGGAARRQADIHAVLPRRTLFSRTAPGDAGGQQIVATNVDVVLLVAALNHTFNPRRIERYLAVAWESGAQPVIVLNKSDLHPDPDGVREELGRTSRGAPVLALSAAGDDVTALLAPWLTPGQTLALLGPSGVGKSTLINRMVGAERQATGAISEAVGKGRHTTTHRELIVTPSGAIVIDTPGMRELQLWSVDDEALDATFSDIAALVARCRFRDCSHRAEPGCAVRAALEDGTLTSERWGSYEKLRREQAYAARKADPQRARDNRDAWRRINKAHRQRTRFAADQE